MEKDDNIKKLQAFRIPEAEDVLVRGAQSMTTADALAGKVYSWLITLKQSGLLRST